MAVIVDPGLMNDSTGEGMAGATDVSFRTQQAFKNTLYNGTKVCQGCGIQLDPYMSLHSDLCSNCTQRKAMMLVQNGMVE
jgi:hypothetical protein